MTRDLSQAQELDTTLLKPEAVCPERDCSPDVMRARHILGSNLIIPRE